MDDLRQGETKIRCVTMILMAVVLAMGGCEEGVDPLVQERLAMEERLSSPTALAYKGLKLLVRSLSGPIPAQDDLFGPLWPGEEHGSFEAMVPLKEALIGALQGSHHVPVAPDTLEEVRHSLREGGGGIAAVDEDLYPPLLEALARYEGRRAELPRWYDLAAEHIYSGYLTALMALEGEGAVEFALYEAWQLNPARYPDPLPRAATYLLRGLLALSQGWYHMANVELTAYVELAEGSGPPDRHGVSPLVGSLLVRTGSLDARSADLALRMVGRGARGLARRMLERPGEARGDLEEAQRCADQLGLGEGLVTALGGLASQEGYVPPAALRKMLILAIEETAIKERLMASLERFQGRGDTERLMLVFSRMVQELFRRG